MTALTSAWYLLFVSSFSNWCHGLVMLFDIYSLNFILTNWRTMSEDKWAATWQNQQCGCAPSEDSDKPGHSPGLIKVFRMKKPWILSYPLSAQRRLWSEWVDARRTLILLVLSCRGSNVAIFINSIFCYKLYIVCRSICLLAMWLTTVWVHFICDKSEK